jgi:hypothetical protein
MEQHDSGDSGTALEAPLTHAAQGIEERLSCSMLFEELLLGRVASRHAARHDLPLHQALADVVNFAEALGCAIFRTHVNDQITPGGTNCTAGGQVWGPASYRINTIISNMEASYTAAVLQKKLDEPAIRHAHRDNGLLVSSHPLPEPCVSP